MAQLAPTNIPIYSHPSSQIEGWYLKDTTVNGQTVNELHISYRGNSDLVLVYPGVTADAVGPEPWLMAVEHITKNVYFTRSYRLSGTPWGS